MAASDSIANLSACEIAVENTVISLVFSSSQRFNHLRTGKVRLSLVGHNCWHCEGTRLG